MINASKQFRAESIENRNFYVTAKCVLNDGTTLNLTRGDFYNTGNGITDSSDSSEFPLGEAIEKTATLTLVNDDDCFSMYDFKKARFTLFLNLDMTDRTETIKRGTFVVIRKPATAEKISLTLADHMYLADRPYNSNLVFPVTAGEVLRDACQTCGIAVGDASFKNSDYIISEKPSNTTFRAVIGYVAMIAGGNAKIDEDDKLRIINFKPSGAIIDAGTLNEKAEDVIDAGIFSSPSTNIVDAGTFRDRAEAIILSAITNLQFDTDDIVVTGIGTTVEETNYLYGTDEYVIKIDNPLIAGDIEDALQRIGTEIIGIRLRPFSCEHTSIPYAEFMDPVYFSDVKGRVFFSYLTDVDFLFNGSTRLKNGTKGVEENESEYHVGNPTIVEQAKKESEKLISAYDIAVRNMNQLAANSLGYYYTQVVQPDGSFISYRHDKPQLTDSKIVYKSGTDGFFVSNDYQGTDEATAAAGKWKSGFDSNGDAVLNILHAIGIQAEWINTRGLTAKDNAGNITFRVNADTGSIDMIVNSLKIQGLTVEQIAEQQAENIVNEVAGDLQSQIDGKIQSYDQTTDPSKSWASSTYADHIGDIWKNGDNMYRWNGSKWTEYGGNDVVARKLAESKATIFGTTPVPPYKVGDMWVTSVENGKAEYKSCIKTRTTGSFVSTDWISPKYTDDTAVNDLDKKLNSTEELFNRLTQNGKIKGIYLENGQLFISFTYAKGGELVLGGTNNERGILSIQDSSGYEIGRWDYNGIVAERGKIADFELKNGGLFRLKDGIEIGFGTQSALLYMYNVNTDKYTFYLSQDGGVVLNYDATDTGEDLTFGGTSWFQGNSIFGSDLTVYGTKSRVIETHNYGNRLQYCYEMATPFFGDIGCGRTDENGECFVYIDDIFLETVGIQEYHVFLQPEGEGNLYIQKQEKYPGYFIVRGTPNLDFSWEIKCRQAGYEYERLNVAEQKESLKYIDETEQQLMAYMARQNQETEDILWQELIDLQA